MEKENKFTVENIAKAILEKCSCDEFNKLQQAKKDVLDQIAQLQTRSELYKNEISDFTHQISKRHDLIDEALKCSQDPEAFAQEIRTLEISITDRKNWIEKTEAVIKEIQSRDKEINQKLITIIHSSLKAYRAEIVAELQSELSEITAKQAAYAEACRVVNKSITGLPGLSSSLCRITFGISPLGGTIQ